MSAASVVARQAVGGTRGAGGEASPDAEVTRGLAVEVASER